MDDPMDQARPRQRRHGRGRQRQEGQEDLFDLQRYDLPDGVVRGQIFPFLAVSDLCSALLACESWNKLGRGNELWKALCARRWRDKQRVSLTPAREAALAPRAAAPGGWRKLFYEHEVDARRTVLTVAEITAIRWMHVDYIAV